MEIGVMIKQRLLKRDEFEIPQKKMYDYFQRVFLSLPVYHDVDPSLHKLYNWYKEMLMGEDNIYIVAGELRFAWNRPDLVEAFKKALLKGKTISIISGPKICHDENNKKAVNPIIDLLKTYNDKLHVYLITNNDYIPDIHFALAGNNVFLEVPHKEDAKPQDKLGKAIKDSAVVKNKLINKFTNLLWNARKVNEIQKLTQVPLNDDQKIYTNMSPKSA